MSPGLWIIAEREYIGTIREECIRSFMMIGEDLAPYSDHTNGTYVVKRGLWNKYDMKKWFIGFTVESILEKCLTTDPDKFGPLPTACMAAGFMTHENIRQAFLVQNKAICLEFARKNRDTCSDFLKTLMDERKVAKTSPTIPPISIPPITRLSILPGYEIDVGKYGMLNINVRQHVDGDDDEGDRLQTITTVSPWSSPCVKIVCPPNQFIKVILHHSIGHHPHPYEEDRMFYEQTIDDDGSADIRCGSNDGGFDWKQDCWAHEIDPCMMESDEGNQFRHIRDWVDGTYILTIIFEVEIE